ncbi:hypothetical protein [Sinorhizobium fredii]|uniref:hypothetical protein n=1 Tax=Rhizobium fredii TaxID=380 RepID=UPI0004B4C7EB|nr:hypothetical protein [Sinorhizobium fredii]
MATTIKQTEAIPASYPATPSGLSTAAQALDPDMIWQRIEAYIAYRWTSRNAAWIVEGCGEWNPPLTPATVSTVEVWEDYAWTETTLDPSPLGGYFLPGDGPYRFTATVGGGSPAPTVPEAVNEAFRRLAEYMAADRGTAGVTREQTSVGSITVATSRSSSWMAQAMQNSGAGDLLRPYRRA